MIRLDLRVRVVLAALSALLFVVPVNYVCPHCDRGVPGLLELWPWGLPLGALVLAPFVIAPTLRWLRLLALPLLATLIQTLTRDGVLEYLDDYMLVIIPGVFLGTVAIGVVTALIAGIRPGRRLLVSVSLAGAAAGCAMWLFIVLGGGCFIFCDWWEEWLFLAGFAQWHVVICLSLYFGLDASTRRALTR